MLKKEDDKFMKRCLELAGKAEGLTYPNPLVGAVVVNNGYIVGEGYHIKAGGPHAEVHAIRSVADKSLLEASTLYVSLEPCSHFGKTPPCTDLLIEMKIPRIVIGTIDTSSKVSGSGIKKLVSGGREVIKGVLEEECRWVNRRFFTYNEKRRPYIILKWAQSADGLIDLMRPVGSDTGPYWITGNSERVLVHRWRSQEQSILVGAGTIRTDKPALNVRDWSGNNPVRLILSGSGNLDKYIAKSETNEEIISFTYNTKTTMGNIRMVLLEKNRPASIQIAEFLYENGIQSLFIEGGAQTLTHFIETGLWDEARIFTGTRNFREGVRAPLIEGRIINRSKYGTSSLEVLVNQMD